MWFFNYNKAVMAYQPWIKGLQPNATELAIQYPEDIWVDASRRPQVGRARASSSR